MADRCPRCRTEGFLSGEEACAGCGWKDPVLEAWAPKGWYQDPANPGMARYYNADDRMWVGEAREDSPWVQPIPTEPPAGWLEAAAPSERPLAIIRACRVLGGHGLGVLAGSNVEFRFMRGAIHILSGAGERQIVVPYVDVVALEIGGPGAQRTGGGFVGGGFGLEGAAEGMLIASALNLLTTRTRINTVVCLQTKSAELFVHNVLETPDAMRIRLSRVFSILRSRQHPEERSPARDPLERLERLARLRDSGVLTEEEFQAAREPLVRQLAEGSSSGDPGR